MDKMINAPAPMELIGKVNEIVGEVGDLSAILAKKADLLQLGHYDKNADVDKCITPGTQIIFKASPHFPPSKSEWAELTVETNGTGGIAHTATEANSAGYVSLTYTRMSIDSGITWTNWVALATATPPQEFDLPLRAGLIPSDGKCMYTRNQFNQVTVTAYIKKADGSGIESIFVADLPVGYRPKKICYVAVVGYSDGDIFKSGICYAKEDGIIYLTFGSVGNTVKNALFQMTFLA